MQYKCSLDGAIRSASAALTLVCDGMYSSLRAKLSSPDIQHPSYFVGLLLRSCSLPWPNYGHVILARPSPILFYPISSTEVCLRPCTRNTQASASAVWVQVRARVRVRLRVRLICVPSMI